MEGRWWMKQVEGNEEYHGVIDDPSSALGILFQGLIFVIKERERACMRWRGRELEPYCELSLSLCLSVSLCVSLSLLRVK